ncbi:MAG: HAD family phosphatase [Candidatus Neomarinimicrobiota bacterium]|jgi:beta-phosphoglucomutase-like phosphatase (HAD superfamily)
MQKKYGLLLDFDGVVVDSEPLYEKVMKLQFDRISVIIDEADWLYFKGKDMDASLKHIQENYYPSLDIEKVKKQFHIDLYKEFKLNMNYIPGFLNFFYSCVNDEFKDLLVTSTARDVMEWTFDNVPVDNIFSGMITASEVENTKPHPEPYLKGAKHIGIPIENCIVIEDSVNGIRAGKAAGAKVIGITTTFPRELIHEADFIVDSYAELSPEILKELLNT